MGKRKELGPGCGNSARKGTGLAGRTYVLSTAGTHSDSMGQRTGQHIGAI